MKGAKVNEIRVAEIPVTIKCPYAVYESPVIRRKETTNKVTKMMNNQYLEFEFAVSFSSGLILKKARTITNPPISVLECCNNFQIGISLPIRETVFVSSGSI